MVAVLEHLCDFSAQIEGMAICKYIGKATGRHRDNGPFGSFRKRQDETAMMMYVVLSLTSTVYQIIHHSSVRHHCPTNKIAPFCKR
jgi:hypothetical protein